MAGFASQLVADLAPTSLQGLAETAEGHAGAAGLAAAGASSVGAGFVGAAVPGVGYVAAVVAVGSACTFGEAM